MMNEKFSAKKIFLIMFRIVSLITILICLYFLYNWHIENQENNDLIDDIRSQITIPNISNDTNEDINLPDNTNDSTPDTSDTNIDFPVVKTKDNDYYLKHNFKKQYNSAGWIFADYRNKFDNTDKNIIIYGHNRRDGSMFSTLKNAMSESWYTNPDNLQIPLFTTSGTFTYQIFSIYAILAQNFNNSVEFSSDEDFKNYINEIKSKSIYNFNVDVSSNDSILTLYTCGNNTKYRVIIHAKKITE